MSLNATSTPRKYLFGTLDKSKRTLPIESEALPTHLPWMPFLAEKGPSSPRLLRLGGAVNCYGSRSFDERSEYATHQTTFINNTLGNGNAALLHRILPDAASTAILRLSVEKIEANVPNYERNEDGSIKYTFDAYDERVPVIHPTEPTIKGFRLVYHMNILNQPNPNDKPDIGKLEFGMAEVLADYRDGTTPASQGNGTLSDIADSTSTLYPIIDFLVADPGGYGNRLGLRLQLPNANTTNPLDTASFYLNRAYLWRIGLLERDHIDGSISPIETAMGEIFIDVALKSGAVTDRIESDIDIETRFLGAFRTKSNDSVADNPAPFDSLHLYRENVEALVADLITAEEAHNDERALWGSMTLDKDNPYAYNFMGGFDELGIPYFAVDAKSSALYGGYGTTADNYLFATAGDDGLPKRNTGEFDSLAITEMFDNKVRQAANNFGTNPAFRIQNYARYPVSAVWDSGYSLETKKSLLNVLQYRKDVAVVLSTYALADYKTVMEGGVAKKVFQWLPDNTPEQEVSLASMLRTYASLYPESEVYGTPTCRAQIVGYSGRIIGSTFKRRVPVTYEYLDKVCKFMGSPEGRWDGELAYDNPNNNRVRLMTDISTTWLTDNVANQAWANGLVYVEDYDTRSLFFPGIRTVYNNETSVLNSSITMWGICHIERVCHTAWRDLTGISKWSNAKFAEESDRMIEARLANVFDDRFVIKSETFYTEADVAAGYSWSTHIHIYANNMKTVGKFTVIAHRMEDYQAMAA